MRDRDLILAALPDGAGDAVPPVFDGPRRAINDLWLEFEERLVSLGGQMVPFEMLPLLLQRDSGYFADEDLAPILPRDRPIPSDLWSAEVGVCLADLAIAETGGLLISAGPGRARLTSLAPAVNVVLVREDAIVSSPEIAFQHLPVSTSVVVTGTSRTADIEGVLVRGVHGPRELYVVRLPAKSHGEESGSTAGVPEEDPPGNLTLFDETE